MQAGEGRLLASRATLHIGTRPTGQATEACSFLFSYEVKP